MRIAAVGFSDLEHALVAKHVANDDVLIAVDPGSLVDAPIDFAIAGGACIEGNDLRPDLRETIRVPALALLDSPERYQQWAGEASALALTDLHRLQFTIRREMQKAIRRQVADATAERAAQMKMAQELAKISSWDLDLKTSMVTTSDELTSQLGMPSGPHPLSEWLDALHESDRDRIANALHRAAAEGAPYDEQFTCRINGRELVLHSRAEVIRDDANRAVRIAGMLQDVTERTLAESALRESEERYRDLVRQVPGIVWTLHTGSGNHFVSAQAETITGYTPEEIMAGGAAFWMSLIHPEDAVAFEAAMGRLAGQVRDEAMVTEYRIRAKNGDWVWVRDALRVIDDATGRRFVGVSIDNTAAHAAQEALHTSEARYRSLVQQAKDIIFAFDTSGRIVSLDGGFEALTGWRAEEWIGRPFVEIADEDSARRAATRFHEVLRGLPTTYGEYAIRKADGGTITIELTAQPVVADQRTIGVVGIGRDVTQRKLVAEEEEKARRLTSIGHLATSVAHEFNNVLMSIMPFAEVLQRRYKDDERIVSSASHIIQAVRRGREISQEILRFARPAPPVLAPVGVLSWIESMEGKARTALGSACEVKTRVEKLNRDDAMLADASLAERVITSLVSNARDAMGGAGTLTLEARPSATGEAIEIDVSDTGCGIPPERLALIFEPLFTTKRTGNGLGLALAQQAMQGQGGTINVRSEPGRGTTFALTFPRTPGHAGGPQQKRQVRRVVIVEDEESVGEGLHAVLTGEGLEVRLVQRGLDAALAIEEFNPDLLLLDVNLPDVNGIDLYHDIQKRWPELPVIFSTARADALALDAVARRVPAVMKPYDVDDLLALMAEI